MPRIIGQNQVKIILALDKAKGAAPIEYISLRTGIEDPCELLGQLEEDGIICRASPSSWSPSLVQYELTSEAKKLLQQLVATRLEQLFKAYV